MRLRLWISLCLIFGLASLALFATSCGSSSKTQIRMLNAIVLYPDLDMLVDGSDIASNIAYGSASGYASVSSGSRHIQIEPSGSSSPIIDSSANLGSGSATTALAYLNTSNAISFAALTDNNAAPSSGNFNIRIINASPAFPSSGAAVDVYVVQSGTNIAGVPPNVVSLAEGSASTYLSLVAGTYDVIFTIPGTKSQIAQSLQVSFGAGNVRTAVVLNGQGGGFTVSVLSDAG